MTEQSITNLLNSLNQNTCIITPNRRLAATLIKQYNQAQASQGVTVWPCARIHSISEWLNSLWEQYAASRTSTDDDRQVLLNSTQELLLWEDTLSRSDKTAGLLRLAETANMAQSAYKLLTQWRLDTSHVYFDHAEDYLALRQWINDYRAVCNQHQWIDSATLPDIIADKILSGRITVPGKMIMTGFTELSPQIENLLSSCKSRNTIVEQTDIRQPSNTSCRVTLPDDKSEIEAIARWAKSLNQREPRAFIGCVFPNLDKNRDAITRVFRNVFNDSTDTAPINISAGKPLADYPVIHTALQLLALYHDRCPRDDFSRLLSSPFVGDSEQERYARAAADKWLRKKNVKFITVSAIQNRSADASHYLDSLINACPKITNRIVKFLQLLDGQKHTWHAWAETFNDMLTVLGWPGERSLNSEEYQTVEAWFNLLHTFATLDYVSAPPDIDRAWQTLRKMAAKQTFQPQTPDAPIQILGLLEAASLPFDYLWLAGMDDLSWPSQPNPNPFIPKQLQREQQMPHSTAEREYHFCSKLTAQFIQASRSAIFSHAMMRDELNLHVSPLLNSLPEMTTASLDLASYESPAELLYRSRQVTRIIDQTAPACRENEIIKGGADILKQQALCPFKAFATHRLGARELEAPEPGLRAVDRGNVIHRLLECIWKKLNDQATLLKTSTEEQDTLINNLIDDAINALPDIDRTLTQLVRIEKQRLYSLITDWMAIERSRPAFRVISSELTNTIQLNQLTISTRPDRVDELEDGTLMIIDYKSGKNNHTKYWFGNRPDEPQLPVYALTAPENTRSLSFAQINSIEMGFKGISDHDTGIKGVKPLADVNDADADQWPMQLKAWQSTMTQLADDFFNGHADVSPKKQACQYCNLTPFCRVKETMIEIEDDTDSH